MEIFDFIAPGQETQLWEAIRPTLDKKLKKWWECKKPTRLCQKITTYENSYRIPIQREQKNWTLLLTRNWRKIPGDNLWILNKKEY